MFHLYNTMLCLAYIKMRPVSHPGTHHIVIQLNLRSQVYASKFFWSFVISIYRLIFTFLLPTATATAYSDRRLLTGFTIAALMV